MPAFRKLSKNEKKNVKLMKRLDEIIHKKKIMISA